jgi:hypothetical protein
MSLHVYNVQLDKTYKHLFWHCRDIECSLRTGMRVALLFHGICVAVAVVRLSAGFCHQFLGDVVIRTRVNLAAFLYIYIYIYIYIARTWQTTFLSWALDECSGRPEFIWIGQEEFCQLITFVFCPGKDIRRALCRRLAGSQGRSGRVRRISSPPEFDPWTVQPVASRRDILTNVRRSSFKIITILVRF